MKTQLTLLIICLLILIQAGCTTVGAEVDGGVNKDLSGTELDHIVKENEIDEDNNEDNGEENKSNRSRSDESAKTIEDCRNTGDYEVVETCTKYTKCNVETKRYLFESGDKFHLHKVKSEYQDTIEKIVFYIDGEDASVRYRDGLSGEWLDILPDGKMPGDVLFIQTNEAFVIVGPAVVYKEYADGSLLDTDIRGSVSMREIESGYEMTISLFIPKGHEAHIWKLDSYGTEMEWNEEAKADWARIDFSENHRLCYDGAYYFTPESYRPYEVGMYYRCPAVHPTIVLLEREDRVSDIMSRVLLDEALPYQNSEGFWPTPAESRWLLNDYGIKSHFYDTRFNNDVTMRLFEAFTRFGDESYLEAALRQTEWLMRHAESNHIVARNGILVEDYGVAVGDIKTKQTHSSLNHQLQEIKVLISAYLCTKDMKYLEFAELLLDGIRSTESKWYNGNRGLAYAISPDGTPGFNDYPYLTYNDLFDVEEMLEKISGRDPVLDRLMDYKLEHMLTEGIQGYKTK